MLKKDIEYGICSPGIGYSINPTVKRLDSMLNGKYIVDKRFSAMLPYVITVDGIVLVGARNGNGRIGLPTPHPTLIGGKNPKVKMAGILDIRGGRIHSYDDRSGHYRPNKKSIKWAHEALEAYPKTRDFKKE